jgi:hypothetical protein
MRAIDVTTSRTCRLMYYSRRSHLPDRSSLRTSAGVLRRLRLPISRRRLIARVTEQVFLVKLNFEPDDQVISQMRERSDENRYDEKATR